MSAKLTRWIIKTVREAIPAITQPRFFATERGYQGELLAELRTRLIELDITDAIVEQEHQKTLLKHGINKRPDIIIHEPFDPARHRDRTEGNYALFLLKLRASEEKAIADFEAIKAMMRVLRYPLAFFLNIGSLQNFAEVAPRELPGIVVSYGIALDKSGVSFTEARLR